MPCTFYAFVLGAELSRVNRFSTVIVRNDLQERFSLSNTALITLNDLRIFTTPTMFVLKIIVVWSALLIVGFSATQCDSNQITVFSCRDPMCTKSSNDGKYLTGPVNIYGRPWIIQLTLSFTSIVYNVKFKLNMFKLINDLHIK